MARPSSHPQCCHVLLLGWLLHQPDARPGSKPNQDFEPQLAAPAAKPPEHVQCVPGSVGSPVGGKVELVAALNCSVNSVPCTWFFVFCVC